MEKIIRWGIAGPGEIANKFAKAMKNVKGAKIVAVASRTEEKGRQFANKYDIPTVFTGYEQMALSDEIDAVYISTPHPFHKPCAEIFLNAKKHVLCEKPVCVNGVQAKSLYECAKKNGVFLMEAMWTRFLPAIEEAAKIAKSGEIGEIKGIKADFCYSIEPYEDEKIFKNDMAGGALLDVGVYCLHFASIILGNNPEKISAVSDVCDGVDLHTNILMKYEGGEIASLSAAVKVQKPATGYVYGTKGYITLPDFYGADQLYVNTDNGEKHILKPRIGDGFEEEIYEVCRCIREGKTQSEIMPMSESIKMMEQMDLIREQINLKYPFDV